jgi:hypothetical protein
VYFQDAGNVLFKGEEGNVAWEHPAAYMALNKFSKSIVDD